MSRRGALTTVVLASMGGGLLLLRDRDSADLSCSRVVELAPEYLSGTLSADLSQQIDAHLSKCPSCDAHLKELAQQQERIG